jgi:hypothetical protein
VSVVGVGTVADVDVEVGDAVTAETLDVSVAVGDVTSCPVVEADPSGCDPQLTVSSPVTMSAAVRPARLAFTLSKYDTGVV